MPKAAFYYILVAYIFAFKPSSWKKEYMYICCHSLQVYCLNVFTHICIVSMFNCLLSYNLSLLNWFTLHKRFVLHMFTVALSEISHCGSVLKSLTRSHVQKGGGAGAAVAPPTKIEFPYSGK